jgi:hypothetical protein
MSPAGSAGCTWNAPTSRGTTRIRWFTPQTRTLLIPSPTGAFASSHQAMSSAAGHRSTTTAASTSQGGRHPQTLEEVWEPRCRTA